MKKLTIDAEIAADGSLKVLTPLPAWVKPGRACITVTVEDGAERDSVPPRPRLTATPDMILQRKAALEEVRKLDPYRVIADPAAWQKEIRKDRTQPFRD